MDNRERVGQRKGGLWLEINFKQEKAGEWD